MKSSVMLFLFLLALLWFIQLMVTQTTNPNRQLTMHMGYVLGSLVLNDRYEVEEGRTSTTFSLKTRSKTR